MSEQELGYKVIKLITVVFILTVGEPDLIDAVNHFLMNIK